MFTILHVENIQHAAGIRICNTHEASQDTLEGNINTM